MDPKLIVEKIYPNAILPVRKNKGDSGLDITFNNLIRVYRHIGGNSEREISDDKILQKHLDGNTLTLQYLERALLGTGLKATVGEGYEIQVRPRSGLALNHGLTVLNTPGTIDAGYRNEICAILVNLSRKEQSIKIGDRIAQLVIAPVILCDVVEGNLDTFDRGGGFGSTGK